MPNQCHPLPLLKPFLSVYQFDNILILGHWQPIEITGSIRLGGHELLGMLFAVVLFRYALKKGVNYEVI